MWARILYWSSQIKLSCVFSSLPLSRRNNRRSIGANLTCFAFSFRIQAFLPHWFPWRSSRTTVTVIKSLTCVTYRKTTRPQATTRSLNPPQRRNTRKTKEEDGIIFRELSVKCFMKAMGSSGPERIPTPFSCLAKIIATHNLSKPLTFFHNWKREKPVSISALTETFILKKQSIQLLWTEHQQRHFICFLTSILTS